MMELRTRCQVAGRLRSGPFWISLGVTVGLAWIACGLAVGVQVVMLFAAVGAWVGLPSVFFFSFWFSTGLTLIGAAVTLPTTLVLALAVRAHWIVAVALYGVSGWLVMLAFLVLRTQADLPAVFALLGVIPAAAFGLVVWYRAMRDRPATPGPATAIAGP